MPIRTRPGRMDGGARQAACSRLFCFPHAGAGAAVFSQWPDGLPVDVEVCVPCLPGRDARVDESASDMHALVEDLAQDMLPLVRVPYALFGHSTGAFIAFEIANALSERGFPPAHLFVSAQRSPSLPYPGRPIYDLPDDEFLDRVVGRYGKIPDQVLAQKDLMAIVLRTLRADFTLNETYVRRAHGPLPCPITAFGGTEDAHVSRGQLDAWRVETTGRFRVHLLPGGHFFHQECREDLLSLVRAELLPMPSDRDA